MKVYSLFERNESTQLRIGYLPVGKSHCFNNKVKKLASTQNRTIQKLFFEIDKLSKSANFLADFNPNVIKSVSGIDNCFEIRVSNVRVPFVLHNGVAVVLLFCMTKKKHGFDKQQSELLKKLAKRVNSAEELEFTEDAR